MILAPAAAGLERDVGEVLSCLVGQPADLLGLGGILQRHSCAV